MICPVCEKGQMIKVNKQNMKHAQAHQIKCVSCGFTSHYQSIKAA
ncbi:MAG: hypothetical protein VX619_01250 [bacterium]|nr:hypothetical protein [bacterium]